MNKDYQKAQEAKRITEDPLVIETLATMQQEIFEQWCDPRLSMEDREELYRMSLTLRRFIDSFELYLQNGAEGRHLLGQPEEKPFLTRIKEYLYGTP